MKIALISLPQKVSVDYFEPLEIAPLALYLLAGVLKKAGHNVSVIDPCEFLKFQGNENMDQLCADYVIEKVREEHYESLAFSSNTFTWANCKIVVDSVCEAFHDIKVVLGGLHVTLFDQHVLEVSRAHIVIRGEGEKIIENVYYALDNNLELSDVNGITYKKNGEIIRNPDDEPLTLEEMINSPLPCYDMMPEENPYSQFPVESSRGCYFSCSFCSIPHRRKWRGIPKNDVLKRVQHALKYENRLEKVIRVLFVDDCFTADGERAVSIFNSLKQLYGFSKKYFIECRISDILRNDILQKIPATMISSMQIGVECGYDEGLKRIRKGLTIKQLFQGLDIIKEYNFTKHCFLSFIIGFPWETMEQINLTLATIEKIVEEYQIVCNLNWLLFLPSDLWKEKEDYNIDVDESSFDKTLWYSYNEYFYKTHPLISEEDIIEVERQVKEIRKKGPVSYRRSIGLEKDYKEPSSVNH